MSEGTPTPPPGPAKPAAPPKYGATMADAPMAAPPPPRADRYGATLADAGAGGSTAGSAGALSHVSARDVYRVVHVIGEGGMGSVSLAKDLRLGRWVALKRLSAQFANEERLLERFRTEARSVAALTHFHIVQVFAMDEDEEGPYIAMEYVEGPDFAHREGWPPDLPTPPLDLEEFVKQRGVMALPDAVKMMLKLCSAVGYAHKRGVIHRDIKPANVMLNEDCEPKLADFGLARQQGAGGREGMTIAGAQLLTLGYGAPEQEVDASRADARADIYALGGTLWYMISGQNPRFYRESEVPAPLQPVLNKTLQKDREKRFQTVAELEKALAALSPHSVSVAAPTADGAPVPGRCPQCGHQHVLGPGGDSARKFCENCGTPLLEPCLKCNAENGVWAKFCGPCGAPLAELVDAARNQLKAERDAIVALEPDCNYDEMIRRLTSVAEKTHPRLLEFGTWAKKELPRVKTAFAAARSARDEAVAKAESLITMCDYAGAVPHLRDIPSGMQTKNTKEMLKNAERLAEQCKELRTEIRSRLTAKQLDGLRPLVAELAGLTPNDAQVQELLKKLDAREAQLDAELWTACARQPSAEAFRRYLAAYPSGKHVDDARAALSPALRELLLERFDDADLRREYLEVRAPQQAQDDLEIAKANSRLACAAFGVVGGALLGAVVGGPVGWIGGVIGGAIGGPVLAVLLYR